MQETGERRAAKPHKYEPWDEYRVITVPRYKTSYASGDEWRTSKSLVFYNKGEVIGRYDGYAVSEDNVDVCFAKCMRIGVSGNAYVTSFGDICDQEGCSANSKVVYKLKRIFKKNGDSEDPYLEDKRPLVRKFCDTHSTRGDCGLDDADDNYELLEGKGATAVRKEFVSKSVTHYI